MAYPKVSVIVPNYNHAPYLRQRLDSIYNQTFQDFEVIILDDCSTDNSKEIIEEYRNRPQTSHIVYNEANSGSPFKQWAKGFDLAKGEYIWIAESDDWANEHFLEKITPSLEKDPSLSIAFSASNHIFDDETTPIFNYDTNKTINGYNFIKSRMIYGNYIYNASAVVFRKKTLKLIRPDYLSFHGSGDYMFWTNMCEHGNVFYLAELLNNFRRHGNTTTHRCLTSGLSLLEDFKIFKYLDQKGYISRNEKRFIVIQRLNSISKQKKEGILTEPSILDTLADSWGKASSCIPVARIICFFSFLLKNWMRNDKYDNNDPTRLPPAALFWTLFNLPNTDIRKKFHFPLHH